MRIVPVALLATVLLCSCDTGAGAGVDVDNDGDGWPSRSDCNDDSDAIHPDAVEVCDGLDNNCNDVVDTDAAAPTPWFADADGDGHGDPGVTVAQCDPPDGFVELGDDCDDTTTAVFTGHEELCDGLDNDCNGEADYDDEGELDEDEDGFVSCDDCDDDEELAYPGAPELCNDVDDDCDGDVDEDSALDAATWYADADGDGWGGDSTTVACDPGDGWVAIGGDCDDLQAFVFPGAVELCDELDNDCDGEVDEDGVLGLATWYLDFDSDGYGNPASSQESCAQPDGWVLDGTDCDDGEAASFPGNPELCDSIDNDCDGQVDIGAAGADTWWLDLDGDGYGGSSYSVTACDQPADFEATSSDCNDGDALVFPGGVELCNAVDDDCDGVVPLDELDGDGDGISQCDGDCDDLEVTVYPGAPELCDGADQDCDGLATDELDVDGDLQSVCDGDCDESDAAIYLGATEVCNNVDDDCDGSVDEGASSTTWYQDWDGDGFGSPAWSIDACVAPAETGWVEDDTDCDDQDAAVNPDASEVCSGVDDDCDGVLFPDEIDGDGDGVAICDGDCDDNDIDLYPGATELCDGLDQDCDGLLDEGAGPLVDWYADTDADLYGDPAVIVQACAEPPGFIDNDEDCDDTDEFISPDEVEVCTDGVENNCDGLTDCDDITGCKVPEATCWVCPDNYVDPDEECDDNNSIDGDGCDSSCMSEMDLSGLYNSFPSGGRTVYVWQSNSSAALSSYNDFCEDRGLDWYEPNSQSDAQGVINQMYNYDSWHTWIITKNNTTAGTWGGYSVTTDSPSCVAYSSSGFSGIRKWGCSFCEPENHGYTRCWDSNHSYDWLLCQSEP